MLFWFTVLFWLIVLDSKKLQRTDTDVTVDEDINILNEAATGEKSVNESVFIYNYEKYCSKKSSRQPWKHLFIKGMYNTGTNALKQFINTNCKAKNAIALTPNNRDHKHDIIKKEPIRAIKEFYKHKLLFLFVIKDPLTWIKSICKHPYDIRLHDAEGNILFQKASAINDYSLSECINDTYRSDTYFSKKYADEKYDENSKEWHTLEEYYNDWYMKPFQLVDDNELDFHFMMIKFEDILFNAESIVKQLCKCTTAGVALKTFDDPFTKDVSEKEQAMKKYLPQHRYDSITAKQLKIIQANIDPFILDTFEYKFDVQMGKKKKKKAKKKKKSKKEVNKKEKSSKASQSNEIKKKKKQE